MFERFTESARAVVIAAREEAGALGHGWVDCEHLLIALAAAGDDDPGAEALRRVGVDAPALRAAVRELTGGDGPDPAALATLGIDLDAVRRRADDAFGPGALERGKAARGSRPFSPNAKKALELALRYAVHVADRHIGSEHLLLGVLRAAPPDGPAARALVRLGVEPERLRRLLEGVRTA